jgi:hypothetical protein
MRPQRSPQASAVRRPHPAHFSRDTIRCELCLNQFKLPSRDAVWCPLLYDENIIDREVCERVMQYRINHKMKQDPCTAPSGIYTMFQCVPGFELLQPMPSSRLTPPRILLKKMGLIFLLFPPSKIKIKILLTLILPHLIIYGRLQSTPPRFFHPLVMPKSRRFSSIDPSKNDFWIPPSCALFLFIWVPWCRMLVVPTVLFLHIPRSFWTFNILRFPSVNLMALPFRLKDMEWSSFYTCTLAVLLLPMCASKYILPKCHQTLHYAPIRHYQAHPSLDDHSTIVCIPWVYIPPMHHCIEFSKSKFCTLHRRHLIHQQRCFQPLWTKRKGHHYIGSCFINDLATFMMTS